MTVASGTTQRSQASAARLAATDPTNLQSLQQLSSTEQQAIVTQVTTQVFSENFGKLPKADQLATVQRGYQNGGLDALSQYKIDVTTKVKDTPEYLAFKERTRGMSLAALTQQLVVAPDDKTKLFFGIAADAKKRAGDMRKFITDYVKKQQDPNSETAKSIKASQEAIAKAEKSTAENMTGYDTKADEGVFAMVSTQQPPWGPVSDETKAL